MTVDTNPSFICVPSTVEGVVEIVKYANKHDLTVRVSGYRSYTNQELQIPSLTG